jgi:hypothetical protein
MMVGEKRFSAKANTRALRAMFRKQSLVVFFPKGK